MIIPQTVIYNRCIPIVLGMRFLCDFLIYAQLGFSIQRLSQKAHKSVYGNSYCSP